MVALLSDLSIMALPKRRAPPILLFSGHLLALPRSQPDEAGGKKASHHPQEQKSD
jgi:hypothetical protein